LTEPAPYLIRGNPENTFSPQRNFKIKKALITRAFFI